jgi:hypothetical protein
MFEIFILIVSLFIVGMMAYIHATAKELPPKAKLVCELWALVEKSTARSAEKREANFNQTISHS